MTGRPTLSIAQKRAQGDTRQRGPTAHAAATAAGLEATRGIPAMPKCLNGRKGDSKDQRARMATARAHWKSTAAELDRENRMALLDEGMLTGLSLTYSLMVEAARSDDWRTRRLFPELEARYLQATDRMGLNESSRARVLAPQNGAGDDLEDAIGPTRKTA